MAEGGRVRGQHRPGAVTACDTISAMSATEGATMDVRPEPTTPDDVAVNVEQLLASYDATVTELTRKTKMQEAQLHTLLARNAELAQAIAGLVAQQEQAVELDRATRQPKSPTTRKAK